MTPEEYVGVDSRLPTCELMTDGEIVAMVTNAGEGASSGEEETGDQTATVNSEPTRISHLQASNAIDILMRFFEQNELATADDIHPL